MPAGRLGGTLVSIELVKYPDVFLRKVSKDVAFPLDDKTRRLITWMTRAMYQHNGIGLAVQTPLGPARIDYAFQTKNPEIWKIQLGVQNLF